MSDPDAPAMNFRSDSYSIAIEHERCPRCGATTRVVALCLPTGHERLEAGDDEPARGLVCEPAWEVSPCAAMILYVEHLPEPVSARLQTFSSGYRRRFSPVMQAEYWANHCAACNAMLEDHDLHCEPEGAFMRAFERGAPHGRWPSFDERLQAAAGGCFEDPLGYDAPVPD